MYTFSKLPVGETDGKLNCADLDKILSFRKNFKLNYWPWWDLVIGKDQNGVQSEAYLNEFSKQMREIRAFFCYSSVHTMKVKGRNVNTNFPILVDYTPLKIQLPFIAYKHMVRLSNYDKGMHVLEIPNNTRQERLLRDKIKDHEIMGDFMAWDSFNIPGIVSSITDHSIGFKQVSPTTVDEIVVSDGTHINEQGKQIFSF
jgi:hypothetical protein